MGKPLEHFPRPTKGKNWNCNNKCRSDCCSEIFLLLNDDNSKLFQEKCELIYPKEYTNWKWVGYHEGVSVENHGKQRRVIVDEDVDFEILHNPHLKSLMLMLNSKCRMLRKNGKCRIFRARPDICRISECPIYSGKKEIMWYAEHTKLREAMEHELSKMSKLQEKT